MNVNLTLGMFVTYGVYNAISSLWEYNLTLSSTAPIG
jgi:hypothetical protein